MRGLLQGPAAEPPTSIQASRRHAGCRSLPPTAHESRQPGAPLCRGAPEAPHSCVRVPLGRHKETFPTSTRAAICARGLCSPAETIRETFVAEFRIRGNAPQEKRFHRQAHVLWHVVPDSVFCYPASATPASICRRGMGRRNSRLPNQHERRSQYFVRTEAKASLLLAHEVVVGKGLVRILTRRQRILSPYARRNATPCAGRYAR